jgi:hypothetical protein
MTERLLQYIWQFQYYNKNELTTSAGDELVIIHQGMYNTNQGPDFVEGRIKVAGSLLVGNIELHVDASDWYRHQHDHDKNYNNVILHVVWNDDETMSRHHIPTLILCDRVAKVLLAQYDSWMKGEHFIPCASTAANADDLVWVAWKERLVIERLERKSEFVLGLLRKNNFHWEEMLWWMLARNFGLYVNAEAFAEMAMSIPYNLLSKHRLQIHQLEALMLGQAGLLDDEFDEKYPLMLKKEYLFLQKKYGLKKINVAVHFLRMRPACFPTVRLAQLAMLMHSTENLFSAIINAQAARDIKILLNITANDYWHYHFTFSQQAAYQPKVLGTAMTNNILVNTVITVLFVYGRYHNEPAYQQKAVEWVAQLPSEHNAVISKFRSLGIGVKSASDSQSLKELKTQYCDKRRCLECAIANTLLQRL